MKRLKATRDFLRPPQSREELAQMLAETLSVADKYVQLMDADTRLAQKHHIHGRLWAWAVYPRIEQLRHHAKQGRITQEWAAEWRVWMNAVERIFVDLLKKQGVLVSGSSGNLHVASIKINPQAHKNFNPLADLGRYRAQLFSDYDFETGPVLESSLELYHYSAHCFPENGLYYNKASLLYKQMQRPLEAVCYSLRAMCVKQPLESAREGFVVIMARFTEAASAEEMPEGIVIEVLRVVDMLLERIALDLFPQSMQLLKYTLERELSRDPDNRHDSLTPLWITMTAIATIHINTQAEMGDDMRNLLQEYACELLSDCVCAPDPKCLATLQPETLHGLAIANQVFLFWALSSSCKLCARFVPWKECLDAARRTRDALAALCGHTRDLSGVIRDAMQLPADSFVPEDTWLRGFVPLNETHGGRAVAERAVRSQPFLVTWAKMDHEQVLPVHCTRMDVLIAAVSATHKINPTPAPAASLDAGKIARRKSDPSTGQSSESIKTVRFEDLEIEDERGDGIGSARQKQAAAGKPLNAPPVGMFESLRALVDLASKDKEIQELKDQRDRIQKQISHAGMRMGPAEMLFDRNTTRIVLDTSYLIQMFDEVVKAVRTRTWQFIIPHAVLTEVRGLAESDRRGREASQVVAFLESVFDDPASEDADLKLRGVLRIETMQGSAVMNTRLGVEARGGHGETFNGVAVRSSDDRILQTCLRKMLEQMASPGYMPGLPPAVVLVTRDINMRLKARAMGIPVVAGLQNVRDALPA